MFMLSRKPSPPPAGPPGYRAYAVGDVHGRLDLLEVLLEQIHQDADRRAAKDVLLVFLGDLIDRGPASAGVVERLRAYRREGVRAIFLLGNHEEVLLRILGGEAGLITKWRWFGGSQCLESYGVDPERLEALSDDAALAVIRDAIPPEHVEFLSSFVDTFRFGDYLFVHAGIRPGVALEEQQQSDLRWIREPFLLDDSDHGFVVVHGHTIKRRIDERPNRIGIDTGACATGVLTAIGIEGTDRWYLDTGVEAEAAVSRTH
jgi:serine/threonine protein phosphatase 1